MLNHTMRTALVYCRTSRHRDDGRSPSTIQQERATREHLARLGYEVEAAFVDDDVSLYARGARPQFEAMLDRVRRGGVDAVAAWHPDRLYRHPTDLEELIDFVDAARIEVITVEAGDLDFSSPSGRMQARMLGTVARYEVEHRSARTRAGHLHNALEGRWKGGPRPYGYRYGQRPGELVVDEVEAAVVREIGRRVLAGERTASIVRDLNRRGVPTSKGCQWRVPTVVGMLRSPTIAGRRVHRGEDVCKGAWEPILTTAESEALRAVLADPKRQRGPIAKVSLLSGGRARCGRCDGPLRTARRSVASGGARIYRCESDTGCGSLSVVADAVDEFVTEAIHLALDAVDLSSPAGAAASDTWAMEIERQQEKLNEIARERAEGVISRSEWRVMHEVINRKLNEARAQATAPPHLPVPSGLSTSREVWPDLDLREQQAIIDAVLERVVVHPAKGRGRGFRPERLELKWIA